MKNIVIIGAGASGMMCAIEAAKNNINAHITILEHNMSAGRKILTTGNGRCNLTNMNMDIKCYRSHDMDRLEELLSLLSPDTVINCFNSMGMLCTSKNGYIYPYSNQASTVNDILIKTCSKLGIDFVFDSHVLDIIKHDDGFIVTTSEGYKDEQGNRAKKRAEYSADAVVIACGGKAYPKLGSDGSGYGLAGKLGIKVIDIVPALTGLKCKEKIYNLGAGVRTSAHIKLYVDHELMAEDKGELQLTEYGISGIPVFQVSRYASYGIADGCKVHCVIDYMPEYSKELLELMIVEGLKTGEPIYQVLCGMLNQKLVKMLLSYVRVSEDATLEDIDNENLKDIISAIKEYYTVIVGTNDYDQAQVCAGGIKLSEVDNNFQVKNIPGLYITGELLDVDGICGGYNLHFAWLSGITAGRSI